MQQVDTLCEIPMVLEESDMKKAFLLFNKLKQHQMLCFQQYTTGRGVGGGESQPDVFKWLEK